jgi:hypothetical protein
VINCYLIASADVSAGSPVCWWLREGKIYGLMGTEFRGACRSSYRGVETVGGLWGYARMFTLGVRDNAINMRLTGDAR